MSKLIIEFQGQEWAVDLREGPNLLGRGASCTIPIKDPQLSREHCEIRVAGAVCTLLDKGSMNGTLVNGSRVQEHRLQPGDRIVIGHMTAWFEVRKAGGGSSSGAVDVKANTRRASTAEPVTVEGLPPDYSLGGRVSVPWRKMAAGVVVLAVLGAGAFLVKEFGTPRVSEQDDPNNVIQRNPSFELSEDGKPKAWSLKSSSKGSLTVAPQGKKGSCLAVEKAAGGDLVLECVYGEEFPLARGPGIEASAWARYDGFNGWAAVKVDWLQKVGGAVVAEEVSPPVPRAAGWFPIQASFTRPADAGAFRVSLAAVGRSGRLAFDEVSVRLKPSGDPGREHRFGTHRVAPASDGSLRIETRGRRSLVNFHARLESTREGSLTQSCARNVTSKTEGDRLTFKGRLVSPADLREVPFEEMVIHKEGETVVHYGFQGGDLRQVDRVALVFTVPRVDRIQGIPEAADKTTNRISFRSDEGEVVVEYADDSGPARVRVEQTRGGLRVIQSFPVDPADTNPVFRLKIREAAGAGQGDPIAQARRAQIQKHYGTALALFREEVGKIKDPAQRDLVESDIKRLEEIERSEWTEVQVSAFQALLSRRVELATVAAEAVDLYQQKWTGDAFAAKAESLREKAREVLAGATADEAARHKLILERARQYAAGGRKALAGSLTRMLLARYPGSPSADEAREFLKTLSEP